MPIYAPNWIFSRFTTWIFGGVRILLVGQCICVKKTRATYVDEFSRDRIVGMETWSNPENLLLDSAELMQTGDLEKGGVMLDWESEDWKLEMWWELGRKFEEGNVLCELYKRELDVAQEGAANKGGCWSREYVRRLFGLDSRIC